MRRTDVQVRAAADSYLKCLLSARRRQRRTEDRTIAQRGVAGGSARPAGRPSALFAEPCETTRRPIGQQTRRWERIGPIPITRGGVRTPCAEGNMQYPTIGKRLAITRTTIDSSSTVSPLTKWSTKALKGHGSHPEKCHKLYLWLKARSTPAT